MVAASFLDDVLDNILGAELIGILVSTLLYGMAILQTYMYWIDYPEDTISLKCLVGSLWILDTLSTIFSIHAVYFYLIRGYGNPVFLSRRLWTNSAVAVTSALVTLIVECFFAYRIWNLGRRKRVITAVTIGVAFLSLVQFALKITNLIESYHVGIPIIASAKKLLRIGSSGTGIAAGCDIIIACSQVYFLFASRRSNRSTDGMIRAAVVYVVHTMALTSLLSLMSFIIELSLPSTAIFVAFRDVTNGCYVNTFLAVLNGRQKYRNHRAQISDIDGRYPSSDFVVASPGISSSESRMVTPFLIPQVTQAPTFQHPVRPNLPEV